MDNLSTGAGMLAHVSGNRRIHHGDTANNAINGVVKPKTVYVRKYQYPISIFQLDEVSKIVWRKTSYLSGGHNVLYLIMLMENKLPNDT